MRKLFLLFCLLPLLLISQRGVDDNTFQHTVRYIQNKLENGNWDKVGADTADFTTYLNLSLTPVAVHDSCDSVRKQMRDTTLAIGAEQWLILYADTSRWAQKMDTTFPAFQTYVAAHAGAGASAADVGDSCDNVRSEIGDSVAVSTSDSTSKMDTSYVPFQAYVANHNSDWMSDTANAVRAEIRDTSTVVLNDSLPAITLRWQSDAADSVLRLWNDSISVALRKDGSEALTSDWAAGDHDITGLNKLETDSAVVSGWFDAESIKVNYLVAEDSMFVPKNVALPIGTYTEGAVMVDTPIAGAAGFNVFLDGAWKELLRKDLSYAPIGDSADAVRGDMRDTVNAWWGDTAAVYAHLSQIRDSVDAWWGDSAATITARWQSDIGDTANDLRAEMVDTAQAYAGIGTHQQMEDTLNASIVEVTQNWWWNSGDTLYFVNVGNDTNYICIDANGKIQIGKPGLAEAESLKIGGGGVVTKWVKVGSHWAMITNANDTMWAAADTSNF